MKQLQLFGDCHPSADRNFRDASLPPVSQAALVISDELAALAVPEAPDDESADSTETVDRPPIATPLPTATEAGVFGLTSDGPIVPDEEEIAALTAEHANEMIILLADSQVMEEALRLEHDPATRRVPKTEEEKRNLLARTDKEWKRLTQSYADAVAAYADAFGDIAAEKLDQWVRKTVADGKQKRQPYPPSHPWHYFHAGDNATPMPVESIEPSPDAGRWLAERLPKNKAKRTQKLRDMFVHEQEALAADKARYADIVERGAEALSRYDRTIAHTSDAMAVATSLALKYTHVSLGLSRVAWLTSELERLSPGTLVSRSARSCATHPE
ncbi:MAG: hypothetical protein HY287_04035 [Planctomycetes bacterium]|nr:hypothetical protein [Planctomycetota bacterium]MBI3833483.1 hypothetical protein [Planctomycetota bacterium]